MDLTEHCRECLNKLGEEFREVHQWLDAFAGTPKYGMRHRRVRHHKRGIEEVRTKWGDKSAEAARLHIISDLKEEGWQEKDPFPRDEKHYVSMGLY